MKFLTKNENSVLYGINDLIKKLIKEVKKLNQEKGCAFVKVLSKVGNEHKVERENAAPLTKISTEQRNGIGQYSTLYSFDGSL